MVPLTHAQRLMLRIVLGDDDRASQAWTALRPRFALDTIDPGTFQILPMFAQRVSGLSFGHPDLPRLHGLVRQASLRARLAARDATAFLGALDAAGIRSLVVDGPPLSDVLYDDRCTRPVTGLDVLTDGADLRAACSALRDAGCRTPRLRTALRARANRPITWTAPNGLACTLRPAAPADLVAEPRMSEIGLWKRAQPVQTGGRTVCVPAPIDLLTWLSLPRKRSATDRRCLWMVDAARALQRSSNADVELRLNSASGARSSARAAVTVLARFGSPAAVAVLDGELRRATPASAYTEGTAS